MNKILIIINLVLSQLLFNNIIYAQSNQLDLQQIIILKKNINLINSDLNLLLPRIISKKVNFLEIMQYKRNSHKFDQKIIYELIKDYNSPFNEINSYQDVDKTFYLNESSKIILSYFIKIIITEYDQLNYISQPYYNLHKRCYDTSVLGHQNFESQCLMLQKIKTSVSDLPEFAILSGWPQRGFIIQEQKYVNQLTAMFNYSPTQSLQDTFSEFILNPKFKCEFKSLYRFYSFIFGEQESFVSKNEKCEISTRVLVSEPDEELKEKRSDKMDTVNSVLPFHWEDLDFNKLYQIHYLYAGQGEEKMSRFGHAMLRLVFCAPYRTKKDEECLKDITYHKVISFRATVKNFNIDILDGILGTYDSQLFILPLVSILKEYNEIELREIFSFPLKLKTQELKYLLDETLYLHWQYKGKYYFFSQNCAVETLNLIQRALFYKPLVISKNTIRPDSLIDYLLQMKLIENSELNRTKTAEFNSLYFPSNKIHYEKVFSRLNLVLKEKIDFEDYIKLNPYNRLKLFKGINISNDTNNTNDNIDSLKNIKLILIGNLSESQKLSFQNIEYFIHKKNIQEIYKKGFSILIENYKNQKLKYITPQESEFIFESISLPQSALEVSKTNINQIKFNMSQSQIITLSTHFEDELRRAVSEDYPDLVKEFDFNHQKKIPDQHQH